MAFSLFSVHNVMRCCFYARAFVGSRYNPTYLERPLTARVFGGMRSQNTDAEWLDMRSTVDAEALIRVGNLTGRQDLMERGVAALRSCFALLTENRTQANGVYPVPQVKGRATVLFGTEPENVDHEGAPQLPGRSGPDWGEVGCLSAAAHILRQFGGAFVDVTRGLCVGVDGVHLWNFTFASGRDKGHLQKTTATTVLSLEFTDLLDRSALPVAPWMSSRTVSLRVVGISLPMTAVVTVTANSKPVGSFTVAELLDGIPWTLPQH